MTREEFTSLLKENQEKLDKYENPEDMTLFAMWCTEKVKEENEKLKKQFEVGEEQYNDLVEEKEKLQEQLSSNTLQLEKLKKQVNKGLYNVCLPYKTGYNKAIKDKETQQKEFIKYLENEIKLREEINDIVLATGFEEILQNYKEIIGDVKNEKENIKEISKRFKFKEILDKAVNDMQGTNLYYSKEFVDDIISKLKEKDKEIERLNNIINELKWKPIEEYDKGNYDWVLVKYFDGDYECVPCVAEKRFGKWHSIDEKEIKFEVKYFFDMQQLDKLQELKGSDSNE